MPEQVHLIAAGLLFVVAVRRTGALWRPGSQRALELGIIFLAGAELFQSGAPYSFINDILGTPAGGSVVKVALGTSADAAVLAITSAARSGKKPQAQAGWLVGGAVMVATAAPLLIWPVRVLSPTLAGSPEFYDTGWRSLVHWLPFLVYTFWALGAGFHVSLVGARNAGKRPLRTGLGLIAAGCVVALVFAAAKFVVLTEWHLHGDFRFWARFDTLSEPGIISVAGVLVALGSGWESVANAHHGLWCRQALWQLRPLWEALRELAPQIELSEGGRDPQFRLRRRVMEVRDGLLAIEERVSPDLVDQVTALGASDARTLAVLVHCLEPGSQTVAPVSATSMRGELPIGGGSSLEDEVRWLKEVTKWYRSPKTAVQSKQLAHKQPALIPN